MEERKDSDSNCTSDYPARSELHDFLFVRQERRSVYPRAALVGLLAGIVVFLFRVALTESVNHFTKLIVWAHNFPSFGWLFPVLISIFGAVISVAITRRFAPEAAGSGIPHLKAVLSRFRDINWKRLLPVKFFGGIFALGSGMALGREGPSVQIGGAVGDAVSKWLKVSERERHSLISAGAGAGLAAAFNTPLAGFLFVLEEVRRDFQPIIFGAALVSSTIASIVARIGSGQFPIFTVPHYDTPILASLPLFAILGVVAGFLGVLFNKSLMMGSYVVSRMPSKYILPFTAMVGSIVGLAGWFYPMIIGGSHELTEAALKGNLLLAIIPLFFVIRLALTTTCYSTGAPGGIFMPLLTIGSLVGLGFGQVANQFFPELAPIPGVYAVVGMAAYFTAIVRAPLTGIVLIVEMTGNYSLMLSLLISCFCAYAVAELLKDKPIYEALLERDLRRGGISILPKTPVIVEHIVEKNSPFDGNEVRFIGLPPGCIIVKCSDGDHEIVPDGTTKLQAHMRITVAISPEAADSSAFEILANGCKARKNS